MIKKIPVASRVVIDYAGKTTEVRPELRPFSKTRYCFETIVYIFMAMYHD